LAESKDRSELLASGLTGKLVDDVKWVSAALDGKPDCASIAPMPLLVQLRLA
jgi:hypothetical protein